MSCQDACCGGPQPDQCVQENVSACQDACCGGHDISSITWESEGGSLWFKPKQTPLKDTCAYCTKPAKTMCSRCWSVKYCDPECQRAHWANHKKSCLGKYDLEFNTEKIPQKSMRQLEVLRQVYHKMAITGTILFGLTKALTGPDAEKVKSNLRNKLKASGNVLHIHFAGCRWTTEWSMDFAATTNHIFMLFRKFKILEPVEGEEQPDLAKIVYTMNTCDEILNDKKYEPRIDSTLEELQNKAVLAPWEICKPPPGKLYQDLKELNAIGEAHILTLINPGLDEYFHLWATTLSDVVLADTFVLSTGMTGRDRFACDGLIADKVWTKMGAHVVVEKTPNPFYGIIPSTDDMITNGFVVGICGGDGKTKVPTEKKEFKEVQKHLRAEFLRAIADADFGGKDAQMGQVYYTYAEGLESGQLKKPYNVSCKESGIEGECRRAVLAIMNSGGGGCTKGCCG
eukprot:m.336367 g.336367  ORF g.336367 m.336367 type:complete len:456 (+) comp17834_c0_seq1:92-1459(+)